MAVSADRLSPETLGAAPLKIVAIVTHNDQGGAQQALIRLCSALAQRGHEISLWFLYKKGPLQKFDFPTQCVLGKDASGLLDYSRLAARLGLMLAKNRPAVLISFLPLANVLSQTIGWALRIPIRIASQRNPVQTYSRLMQLLDWYLGTCGSYTRIVVNSSDVRSSVSGYPWPYRLRTELIHNGVDSIELDSKTRSSARNRFRMEKDEIALVSVGRLAKQKNQVLLIQILGALRNFKLYLAGSGPELSRLEAEADRMGVADRVFFLGSLDQQSARQLINAADIFALPSLYEGQSNALLEAMSAGRSIVTSDIPSHRETLTAGGTKAGHLVPITDPDRWISTLIELGNSAEQRHTLGQLAKERAQSFSLGHMCDAFERSISSSLRSSG